MTTWVKRGSLATSTNTGLYVDAEYWLEGYIDELDRPGELDVAWNEVASLNTRGALYVFGDYWLEGYIDELDEVGPLSNSWNAEANKDTTWH